MKSPRYSSSPAGFPSRLRRPLLTIGLFLHVVLGTATAFAGSPFVRGDANGDGAIDISDGITILQYLFSCGEECPMVCDDAADYDDNGAIEITDAVRIFDFLFQGGAGPDSPYPAPGDDTTEDDLTCGIEDSVVQVAARGRHSCARTNQGDVFCWGENGEGQLGDGTALTDDSDNDGTNDATENNTGNQPIPAPVLLEAPADGLALGAWHTCALASGSVWCFGDNSKGQLGDGSQTDSSIPIAVPGLSEATQITAGARHTCALLADASVQCWGSNDDGQLGDGTDTERGTPAPVSGLSDVTAIAAGYYHTCALGADGSVSCWGNTYWGAVGVTGALSRFNDALTPVVVEGLPTATALSAGAHYSSAVGLDGSAWCWGADGHGQCGDGEALGSPYTMVPSPVEVAAPALLESLSLGSMHSCGVTQEGEGYCWGWNTHGQVGDGTTDSTSQPVPVTELGTVLELAAGAFHTCALTEAQAVWCWGGNQDGQLGDTTTQSSLGPVQVHLTEESAKK